LPEVSWPTFVVAGSGFLLGCRHGLDWDHITAIADLTAAGAPRSDRRGRPVRNLGLALWYCIGHGLVIVLLGLAVGVLGLNLPDGVDRVFESVVGATLIALGGFVLWQLGRDRTRYQYTSRWRPVVGMVRRAWASGHRRGAARGEALDDLGPRSALAIGVLHGTGAETPTQVVVFASAGAAGRTGGAALILLAFVAGLILSDLGIAAVWLTGLLGSRRAPHMHIALGVLTGVSSVAVGAVFLMRRSAVLPALFGG